MFAVVDDTDYQWLSQWKWSAHPGPGGRVCPYRKVSQGKGKVSRNVWIHRMVLKAPADREVDHINGDALDNRRENLRLAPRAQNLRNRKTFKINKSGYKGVAYNTRNHKWKVTINLGTFDNLEEAARAYDEAIKKLFDTYSRPNLDG